MITYAGNLFVKETLFKVFKNILSVRSLYFAFFKSNPFFQVFSKSIKLSNCQTLKQEKKYYWNLNDSPSEYVVQQSESKKFGKLLFNSDLQRGYLLQYVQQGVSNRHARTPALRKASIFLQFRHGNFQTFLDLNLQVLQVATSNSNS